MQNLFWVIFSLMLFIPFFIVGYTYHTYKNLTDNSFSIGDYNSNVSYAMDELGCVLIYNTPNHTLSAMSFDRDHWWFSYLINLMFWDKCHCCRQWLKEFDSEDEHARECI